MRRPVFDRLTLFGYTVGVVLLAGSLLRALVGLEVSGPALMVGLVVVVAVLIVRRRHR
jgi:hypothetical protein